MYVIYVRICVKYMLTYMGSDSYMCQYVVTYMRSMWLCMYIYVIYVLIDLNMYVPPFIYVNMYVDIYVNFAMHI